MNIVIFIYTIFLPLAVIVLLLVARRIMAPRPVPRSIDEVREKATELPSAGYVKYLTRSAAALEARIVQEAEQGRPKDEALLALYRYVKDEQDRLKGN